VLKLRQILEKGNPEDRVILCGENQPKLRVLSQVVRVPTDAEALALIQAQSGWANRLILTDPTGTNTTDSSVAADPQNFKLGVQAFTANSLSVNVTNLSPAAAWLVYAEAYVPDWHARVNGKPVTVEKAYGAFKAVRVEPGENAVQFYYDNGFRSTCLAALVITAAGAGIVTLGFLVWLALKQSFTGRN
jgi:hypothetical protein